MTSTPGRVRRTPVPLMTDRLELGATGLSVSPFCLGWVRDPATVEVAFDAGINFFFVTADMHWPTYDASRRGLAQLLKRPGVRDRVVVAVVSYVTQPEFAYAPFLEVLEEVAGLDRVDMIVVGGAYGPEFAVRHQIYRNNRAAGAFGARAIGATFHDRPAAIAPINSGALDIAFVRSSPAFPGARTDLFPKLAPSSTYVFNFNSTIGYTPPEGLVRFGVTEDHWQPAVTDYFRFALSSPAVDGLLCSLQVPRHVEELAEALALPPLDDDEQQYLLDLARLCKGGYELVPQPPPHES
jgi:hypothetical protein